MVWTLIQEWQVSSLWRSEEMRAVIFFGLCAIADAINPEHLKEQSDFLAVIFLVAAFMDIIEFILKINRNDKN